MNGLVGGPLLVGGMGPLNPALLIVVLGTGARAKGKVREYGRSSSQSNLPHGYGNSHAI